MMPEIAPRIYESNIVGRGICNGSFGELLQGVLPGNKKFLFNLKIQDRSSVTIELLSPSYSDEKESKYAQSYALYSKSYKIVRNIMGDLGRHDDYLIQVESTIPIGKGLSSSTADMVASVKALSHALRLAIKPEYISRMITEIEPNDGLHFAGTSSYHHTTGELIANYPYIPPFSILGVDCGGLVDTVKFNQREIVWTAEDMNAYEVLLKKLDMALLAQNVQEISDIATESTERWQKILPKTEYKAALNFMRNSGGIGLLNAHSGTYLGILYERLDSKEMENILQAARKIFSTNELRIFQTLNYAGEDGG